MILVRTFVRLIRRFRLLALLALVAIAAFACTQEAATAANEQKTRVVAEASDNLEQVEQFLGTVEVAADAAADVADDLMAFREAYDAEEYSDAVGHLREALARVSEFVAVPPEVAEHLAQAEALLTLLGK